MADSQDFVRLIEPVARLLLGEPNEHLSTKGRELRFGSRGSMSVDLEKATWIDHETNEGGGFLDLVSLKTGTQGKDRFDWLEQHGFHIPRDEHHRGNGVAQPSGTPKLGKIVKTYDYTDEEGTLLFQVVRFEPKDFRQRKPDKSDPTGWSWKIKGVRQVPYRLNEVVEAVASDVVVFIVEGEKDVDNLWEIGVPATTNAGGCGKWRRELSQFFRDADVVVIQDNDPQTIDKQTGKPLLHEDGRPKLPGQDHAQQVARDLFEVARRVRVLDLAKRWTDMPAKGDVTDWIKAGGSTEALFNLADLVPDWSPDMQPEVEPPAPVLLVMIDIARWDGVDPPPRKWVVRDRIPARNVTLFTGEGGVGKTLLMQQLSIATVLGRDWIGSLVEEPGPVIFVTAEDDEDELHFRYSKIIAHYGANFLQLSDLHIISLAGKDAVLAAVDNKGIVKPTKLFEQLCNSARAIRPRWIGIDTAADVFIVDERSRSEVRQCISLLRGLALEVDTAVVLLAHPSLAGIQTGTGLSGSTAWNNSVRSRLYLKTPKKEAERKDGEPVDDVRILETMKANYGPIGDGVRLVWKNGLLLNADSNAAAAFGNVPPKKLTPAEADKKADDIFLDVLARFDGSPGRTASDRLRAPNYAPTLFAQEPEIVTALGGSRTRRREVLERAMRRLIQRGTVFVGQSKALKPSERTSCLYANQQLDLR